MEVNQKLRAVRQREGLSTRTMARRLRLATAEYELLESDVHELTVKELIDCCEAMSVPVAELFDTGYEVPPRANVIRAYKSALALGDLVQTHEQRVIVDRLRADLLKIIPTMDGAGMGIANHGVSAWPAVGHRRSPNEPSVRELCPIDTKCFSTDATHEHA